MIKALIFDADGMVITPPQMFSDYFIDKQKLAREAVIPFFEHDFKDCLVGKNDLKVALKPYLSKWHWSGSVTKLLHLWHSYEDCPNQPLLTSIDSLRKHRLICVLATNQDCYRSAYMANTMKLHSHFDAVYTSCALGCLKPSPDFFQIVFNDLKRFKIKHKKEVQFWDDRDKYVAAAKKFGLEGHVYTTISSYQKALPY